MQCDLFRYQLNQPIDLPHDTWRGVRYAENVLCIDWLYTRTGDPWLLDLAQKQLAAGFDWTDYFFRFPWRDKIANPFKFRHEHHIVNVAMGLKTPALHYRHTQDPRQRQAVYTAWQNLDAYHGMVTGIFTGDEHLAGLSPSQGQNCAPWWKRCSPWSICCRSSAIPALATAWNRLPTVCCRDV